jgi:serine/threonine protein kinase
LREVAFYKSRGTLHPNIVLFHEIIHEMNNDVFLVLGYMHMNLFEYLKRFDVASAVAKYILYQILDGVTHIHSLSFVHRDIKPENVLIDLDMNVRLSDFGLMRRIVGDRSLTCSVCTLWYRAPELLLGIDTYNPFAVDIWSVGCTFHVILKKRPLFRGDCQYGQLIHIFEQLGTPTEWPFDAKEWDKNKFPQFVGKRIEDSEDSNTNDYTLQTFSPLFSMFFEYDHTKRASAKQISHALDKITV